MEFFEYINKRYSKYINQPWNKTVLKDFSEYLKKDIIVSSHPINQYLILSYIIEHNKMIDVCCLTVYELLDIFVGRNSEYASLSDIVCDLLIIENISCTLFKQKENLIIQMIESQKRKGRKCIMVSPLDLLLYKDQFTDTYEFGNLMNNYSKVTISHLYSKREDGCLIPVKLNEVSEVPALKVKDIEEYVDVTENKSINENKNTTINKDKSSRRGRSRNKNKKYNSKESTVEENLEVSNENLSTMNKFVNANRNEPIPETEEI